jgi:hypothetical protein
VGRVLGGVRRWCAVAPCVSSGGGGARRRAVPTVARAAQLQR